MVVHSPRLTPFWQTKTLECGWFTNSGFGLIVLYYSEARGMRFSALNQSAFKKIHCRGDKNNAKCAQMSDTLPGLTGAEVCSGKHIACRLRLTSVADLICNPHKKKICRVNKTSWTLNFGVAASRRTSLFPVLLSGCQLGCFGCGPAAPHDPGSGCCPVGFFH